MPACSSSAEGLAEVVSAIQALGGVYVGRVRGHVLEADLLRNVVDLVHHDGLDQVSGNGHQGEPDEGEYEPSGDEHAH